jgi:acyl dehydratase
MALSYESIAEGDKVPELRKEAITQLQLIRYAGASGDFNPIHTIPDYAKEAGLDGTIAHGMLTMGILAQLISSWAGVKPVVKYGVSFKGMAKPGDELTATGEVTKKYETDGEKRVDLSVRVTDGQGDVKIDGKVTLRY